MRTRPMSHCVSWLTVLGVVAFVLSAGDVQAQNPPPRLDTGGPLPEGAIARLGTVRFHIPNNLVGMAFSPDARVMAVIGTRDDRKHTVHIWETTTGKSLARFDAGKDERCHLI